MIVFLVFVAILAIAGGASRPDALGQACVRWAAGLAIAVLIVVRPGLPVRACRWPLLILGAAMIVPLLQLVPLPPSMWPALPGHAPFLEAATVAGAAQPWRPISLQPDATWNAFFSLLVPAAMLVVIMALEENDRGRLPGMVFALAGGSAVLAVLQLSRAAPDNPFINETGGTATGLLANVNHQALLMAIGIVAGAAWATKRGGAGGWRLAVWAGAAVWFLLMILASGSRTGLALGTLAILMGIVIAWRPLKSLFIQMPIWLRMASAGTALAAIFGLGVVSITAGRAVSFDRLLALSAGDDMRSRALPTVMEMVRTYMPFGSGFGSFAALFHMHEPDALLKLTHFNHVHSDYIEVALDGGVVAIILIVAALLWAGKNGAAAWRRKPSASAARLGSAMTLLIALASIVDYPMRTPLIMALLALAAALIALDRAASNDTLRLGTEHV